MASKRAAIVQYITEQLKHINKGVSPWDSSYTFTSDIHNNSKRQLRFLDEVNDFPSLYLTAGTETRDFQSQGLTVATLDITIRLYVYGEDNSQVQIDSLLRDIEHVIYSLNGLSDIGILDITIDNITTDEGLVTPYGLAEIELSTIYRL